MYFENVKNLEELKKEYKKLAMKNHPDRGGSVEKMVEINTEYDKAFQKITNNTEEKIENNFKNIINKIINYDINIEIIGTWIWLTGNTKKYKEEFKKLNFKWARKKEAWYYHEEEYNGRRYSKNNSLSDIRIKYGSVTIDNKKKVLA